MPEVEIFYPANRLTAIVRNVPPSVSRKTALALQRKYARNRLAPIGQERSYTVHVEPEALAAPRPRDIDWGPWAGTRYLLSGYALFWGSWCDSDVAGETLSFARGAFSQVLQSDPCIPLTLGHWDPGDIVAWTADRSLRIFEDVRGLRYEALLKPDYGGREVLWAWRTGRLNGASVHVTSKFARDSARSHRTVLRIVDFRHIALMVEPNKPRWSWTGPESGAGRAMTLTRLPDSGRDTLHGDGGSYGRLLESQALTGWPYL
jgi:hypothetical protein